MRFHCHMLFKLLCLLMYIMKCDFPYKAKKAARLEELEVHDTHNAQVFSKSVMTTGFMII